jgi:uncharacterized protein YeaO (DUF488 family)
MDLSALPDEPRRSRAGPIRLKRIYDPPEPADGCRILVDRLWPRGLTREAARIDLWLRAIAPSDTLRRWYGHDPAKWPAFVRQYREELAAPERQAALTALLERARQGPLTLLTAARDLAHSNAAVLRQILEEQLTTPGETREQDDASRR